MRELQPDIELTLIDLSAAMLGRASDLPGEHVQGSVLELPFADGTFDVVVSAWVIETVLDPMRAVSEYLRVIKPDGHVFYTFCSLPVAGSRELAAPGCAPRCVGASRASSSTARARPGTTATARGCSGSATALRRRSRSRSAAALERPCCRALPSHADTSESLDDPQEAAVALRLLRTREGVKAHTVHSNPEPK